MAEESSEIKLTRWKFEGDQSHTSHSSFSFSLTLSLSLALCHSHKLIILVLFSYTLTPLLIYSIELISTWTISPNSYLNLSHSARVMSHISLSLSLSYKRSDWTDVPHDLGFFFVPFFYCITSRANDDLIDWVSEWEELIPLATRLHTNSLGVHSYSRNVCFIPTHSFFHSHSHSHLLIAFYLI